MIPGLGREIDFGKNNPDSCFCLPAVLFDRNLHNFVVIKGVSYGEYHTIE